MGTNYYWRHNPCDHCGRYDELHIGKSGCMFEGHFGSDDRPQIVSWADWRAALRSGGEVWDEYRERVDTEEFIAYVEQTPPERRRRQYDWVSDQANWLSCSPSRARVDRVAPGYDWLDADGFSFYGEGFT